MHIFPVDSNTEKYAKNERELTVFPSLWITLKELEKITEELKVYNQVTCKTKREGQIIKPFAVIAFNEIDEQIQNIAKKFGVGIVIVHPNEDAINYDKDLLYEHSKLNRVSSKMKELYGIDVKYFY